MAKFGPLRVRDMHPPEDVIPACAWSDVLRRLGDEVIARPKTVRTAAGEIKIGVELDGDVVQRVKDVLREHGLESEGDEPWAQPVDWTPPDPNAWKDA